ncbi:universal stress protein [Streptomyces sp. NBC_00094]|uniref:universal stress protein n=1 Tax=Streptomyces sp. NBC_00094 TaxID=2903620 RepID=UPI002B1DFC2D|nr:universal stress protein [Streptomyces sp. NBC_00094]
MGRVERERERPQGQAQGAGGGRGDGPGSVLVGADGSESALRAVEAAAHEARVRGARLTVVHAFIRRDGSGER